MLEYHHGPIDFFAEWRCLLAKRVKVELDHASLLGSLFVDLLLLMHTLSDASDDGHADDDARVEDAETKPGHCVELRMVDARV